MPRRVQTPMSARRDFIEDGLRGLYTMTELCARYGISRRIGYKWVARFEEGGLPGLAAHRRTPPTSPTRISPDLATALLAARRAHPPWGPRKLLPSLQRRHPPGPGPWRAPSGPSSSATAWAPRAAAGRTPGTPVAPPRPSTPRTPSGPPDFRGQFRLGSGDSCSPLTVVDASSRSLLGCQGLPTTAPPPTQARFARLFRTSGLPERIRTDNGGPFAPSARARLARLSRWGIPLGILPERIEPGRPAQHGRHARMHRTLNAEATKPARATFAAHQRRFGTFRREDTEERPHAALGNAPPATVSVASPRASPRPPPEIDSPGHFERRLVSRNGGIRWQTAWVHGSPVRAEEDVGLEEVADGVWAVSFGPVLLGRFDARDGHIHGAHNRNQL